MYISDIVNDKHISSTTKDYNKFIYNNIDGICTILDQVQEELSNVYKDVTFDGDSLTITLNNDICEDSDIILINNALSAHTDKIFPNLDKSLGVYLFKIYIDKNIVCIKRR